MLALVADHDMVMVLPKDIPTLQARNTKNWMRPDNIFCSSSMEDLYVHCEVVPKDRGPCTDHVPIVSVIDLPLVKKAVEPIQNFRMADWEEFGGHWSRR